VAICFQSLRSSSAGNCLALWSPNPNSRYHLNNVKTASLLHRAVTTSTTPPKAVMLGHLSEERNRRTLAIREVARMFDRRGAGRRFHLDAAPAHTASEVIEL
jgi:hypothetical protein